jgi:hypothetical protein
MAKVFLGNIPTVHYPVLQGVFITRQRRGVTICQSWPRKRGSKNLTAYDWYKMREFALAAAWAGAPVEQEMETAMRMAEGTDLTWRDFITMGIYGKAIEIEYPPGNIWPRFIDVAPNPYLMLDQITSIPGSILFRDHDTWSGLSPGSNGYVLQLLAGIPAWQPAPASGGGGITINLFTASGTWTRPSTAQRVRIIVISGGGGGGAGARRASGTLASGGAGGGGGGMTEVELPATTLNATETVTVGIGGTGGTAVTTDNTNGPNGATGTQSSCTAGFMTIVASASGGGNGGSTTAGSGGTGGTNATYPGGSGASAGAGASGATPPGTTSQQATGGGSGGGSASPRDNRNGGSASLPTAGIGINWTQSTGGIATTKTPPGTALATLFRGVASQGGGGGWSASDGTAGDGAAGALYGGGGGGGGASTNGNPSGKGGDGANGAVLILTW